ncbi:hypothetical protein [Pararhizobium gei]|uniref:hypothetical protein n=1 Tax=Pararhizobium gei TaxID=1395951 RepID=UPI0023DCE301|nr:hypothetical protein [Rhizobium gei]
MADFVAVIRRTVDGLSDNVPEMRTKVYDKARGAVRRQLENMKPRPSDEMIERQMTKLEAAIREVEDDHAEALPPLEDEPAAAIPAATVLPPEPVDTQVQPVAAENVAPAAELEPEPEREPDPVVVPDVMSAEPANVPAEAIDEPSIPPQAEPVAEQPDEEHPVAEAEPVVSSTEDAAETPLADDPATEQQAAEPLAEHSPVVADEPVDAAAAEEPEWQQPVQAVETAETGEAIDHLPEAVDVQPADEETYVEPPVEVPPEIGSQDVGTIEQPPLEAAQDRPMPPATSEWELPEWNDPVPVSAHSEPVLTVVADEVTVAEEIPDLSSYEPVETVTVLDAEGEAPASAGDPSHSWSWEETDPFAQTAEPVAPDSSEPAIADWSWPVEKATSEQADRPAGSGGDNWSEIEELLAQGTAASAAGAAAASRATGSVDTGVEVGSAPARPISYRAEPKPSRFNIKAVAILLVVLLLITGGGYAYWQNRTTVDSWVASTVGSLSAELPGQQATEQAPTENAGKDLAVPETSPQTTPETATPSTTDVAALDSGNTTKFTQRLKADGTEIDEGPAATASGAAAASAEEGKSVAAQTQASQPPQDAAQASPAVQSNPTTTQADPAAGVEQPAQTVPEQQTAVDPATQQIPAGAQKMFLYEERLGQSAPTAIEGNVAWSVKEESPGDDAKPEPVIQAQINVPERGLTALMTIKRNADASLPASHVIEFVFSLPENFEGGSIDNVQRVSMKRAEQERGDPLIAVPAKITDDFHMIALNDFPEAVTTNTDLLRNRNWIDIPLTYRNGRRALLTLEKGPAGTEAFNTAMQAWSLVTPARAAGQ